MAGNGLNASPIVKRPHRLKMSHQTDTNVLYVWNDDFTIFQMAIDNICSCNIGIILTDGLAMILFRITI